MCRRKNHSISTYKKLINLFGYIIFFVNIRDHKILNVVSKNDKYFKFNFEKHFNQYRATYYRR